MTELEPLDVWLERWLEPPADPVHAAGGEPPDARLTVALLRAGLAQDDRAVRVLTHGVNLPALVAAALGLASAMGEALYGGAAALDAALSHWQRTGDLPRPPSRDYTE